MTGDASLDSPSPPPGILRLVAAFVALVALTSAELVVIGLDAGRPARITALAALLLAKVGFVLSFFMHARERRRASWFALAAIGFAGGAGVVLLLETAYRVTVR